MWCFSIRVNELLSRQIKWNCINLLNTNLDLQSEQHYGVKSFKLIKQNMSNKTNNILYINYCVVFCLQIYMNAAWHGWAIPMFLFLAILRLSLNYLIAR